MVSSLYNVRCFIIFTFWWDFMFCPPIRYGVLSNPDVFCHIVSFIFILWHKSIKKTTNYIIVTDMEGNIRIDRLPKGRGTDQWKWYCLSRNCPRVVVRTSGNDIAWACGSGNIISTSPYHDPWAVCLSWYCPTYQ